MAVDAQTDLDRALDACPVIAILRGITPEEVVEVAAVLYDAGIRVVEVPLNSPRPYESIQRLVHSFADSMVIGAGTVLTVEEVQKVAHAGGRIVVTPNLDESVIRQSIDLGLIPVTGVGTVSEAFNAVRAGTTCLKLFPANAVGANWVGAALAVLPPEAKIFAVGGVDSKSIPEFMNAGCSGVGTGSNLYAPGLSLDLVAENARAIVATVRDCSATEIVEQYGASNCQVGESPIWCDATETVVWVDPVSCQLLSASGESGQVKTRALENAVSAIMPAGEGRYYGLADNQLLLIDQAGKSQVLNEFTLEPTDSRFNDATIDPYGRIWAGTLHRGLKAGTGQLLLIDPQGLEAKILDTGLGACNGLDWGPGHSILYLVDTLSRILIAYDCDMESGAVSRSRILSDFQGIPGKPDGLCVAPDGDIWVAMWGGGAVVRLSPRGEMLEVIDVPAPNVSSCCIGGVDSDRLFISTSCLRMSPAMLEKAPLSGSLLVSDLHPGVLKESF